MYKKNANKKMNTFFLEETVFNVAKTFKYASLICDPGKLIRYHEFSVKLEL